MADLREEVRLPRAGVERLEDYLARAVRRLADTPGVETQQLAVEGEEVLLDLAASRAKDATRAALWGPSGRPSVPSAAKSNRPEIPAEVKT